MGGLVQILKLTPVYWSYRDKTRLPYFLAYKNPVSNFMKLVLTIQMRRSGLLMVNMYYWIRCCPSMLGPVVEAGSYSYPKANTEPFALIPIWGPWTWSGVSEAASIEGWMGWPPPVASCPVNNWCQLLATSWLVGPGISRTVVSGYTECTAPVSPCKCTDSWGPLCYLPPTAHIQNLCKC